jgi:hypothetical protein
LPTPPIHSNGSNGNNNNHQSPLPPKSPRPLPTPTKHGSQPTLATQSTGANTSNASLPVAKHASTQQTIVVEPLAALTTSPPRLRRSPLPAPQRPAGTPPLKKS